MRKLKFMVIEAPTPSALEEAVSHYLDRGWRCNGGPNFFKKYSLICFLGKKTWFQGMSWTPDRRKPAPPNTDGMNVMMCPLCQTNRHETPTETPVLN